MNSKQVRHSVSPALPPPAEPTPGDDAAGFEAIVGRSPLLLRAFAHIRRVAPYFRTLLVSGETGTGKDLVARAIHRLSPAAGGRFVVLNCSAVVETLFESELFGHVRGSFTGAVNDKPGLFEHADGGTLFLDEIGDMPLATQAKLLRVLQNQEVQRVGSLTSRQVNVRVIAATNADLCSAILQKRFREDLYYRLTMVEIRTPPLRERMEDLPLLERHFLNRFAREFRKDVQAISAEAEILLARHSWPGNVRELENAIGHAAMMAESEVIQAEDLPTYLQAPAGQRGPVLPARNEQGSLDGQERQLIARALETVGGNQCQAARLLRISRDRLRYKIKKHRLDGAGRRRLHAAPR